MNLALNLERDLRLPSRFAPLLLPVLPLVGAYGASDSEQFGYLIGACVLLGVGLVYSVGLGWYLGRCHHLVRKEIEQIRPVWLIGLLAAQIGLLYGNGQDLGPLPVVGAFALSLMAAATFGIEFQQRTIPGLLCVPMDRIRLWAVKMSVLAAALLSVWIVLVLATMTSAQSDPWNLWPFLGGALGIAFIAWGTVPLWTLWTRSLLAGLVFSFAVPAVGGSLVHAGLAWLFGANAAEFVIGSAALFYLLAAPFVGLKRWLSFEAPDQHDREISGRLLGRSTTSLAHATRRPWRTVLLGKELRLQSVSLTSFGAALLLTFAKPYIPAGWLGQELIVLLIGLLAVLSVVLTGSTAIAEERRLGTLDSQILVPVARTIQWLTKLGFGLAVTGIAIGLFVFLLPRDYRETSYYASLGAVLLLFVFTFLASSTSSNSLRALLLGLAQSGGILGLLYLMISVGLGMLAREPAAVWNVAIHNSEAWFAEARALSEKEATQLTELSFESRIMPGWLAFVTVAAAVPLVLALAFSHRNFCHPASAGRGAGRQFLACLIATFVSVGSVLGSIHWIGSRATATRILAAARRQVDLESSLSPAERLLYRHFNRGRLDPSPHVVLFLRRTPSGGFGRSKPADTQSPGASGPSWIMDTISVPLSRTARALIVLDGDIPEDIREALRQEAIATGDTSVPPNAGKPAGPWPGDRVAPPVQPGMFRMSPELMRRYGLVPKGGDVVQPDPTNPLAPNIDAKAPSGERNSPARTPAPGGELSPELMRRYGLTPAVPAPDPKPVKPGTPK